MQQLTALGFLFESYEVSVVFRIILATLLGGTLGFERTRRGRPAGLRTYMLVSLSACLVMLAGHNLYITLGPGFDPARMAAQVLSGIGFLGAGTIMVTRVRDIRGLTTAAGLFAAACIGIATGLGFYLGAVVAAAVCLLILVVADRLEAVYISSRRRMRLSFVLEEVVQLRDFVNHLKARGIAVHNVETFSLAEGAGLGASCFILFPTKQNHAEALEDFSKVPGVVFIEELDG